MLSEDEVAVEEELQDSYIEEETDEDYIMDDDENDVYDNDLASENIEEDEDLD